MKGYFIIKSDGTSIFDLPYPKDFIFHCLILLMDKSSEPLRVLSVDESLISASVQRDRGKGDKSPLLAFLELEIPDDILKYILK